MRLWQGFSRIGNGLTPTFLTTQTRTLFTDSRTTQLNKTEINGDGRYVLYWMQLFKRCTHNFALNKAIEIANALKLPLVVYEGLKYYYPWASDRLHTFILEGVEEKKKTFSENGIRYVFYLQKDKSSAKNTIEKLAKEAAVLVTDDYPCFIVPGHNKKIVAKVAIPVYAVDSNGIIPISCFPKEEYAARTIRPKINRLLSDYSDEMRTPKLLVRHPRLELDCPETKITDALIPKLVAACDIDHSVTASEIYKGGEEQARKRLRHFISGILPDYAGSRNRPEIDGSSRLSPWLHFGYISAQEIYHAVLEADAPRESKDAFLEELIIRRELSFNLTSRNPEYDSLDALPDWAKKTMKKHEGDKREVTYSRKKLEQGETQDALWNACQHELIHTGGLHNYMRMLWGKKIIEWTKDYETAFRLMVDFNNKYALDGRDPNSYAGILWCFGKHDRAWGPERPVFGTLRYLSTKSWWSKVRAKEYIRKYSSIDVNRYEEPDYE